MAESALLHNGLQQMAGVRSMAAPWSHADEVLSLERRQSEFTEWRRKLNYYTARERYAGQLYIRSDESRSVARRQCLLHGQRGAGRIVRPDQDGAARRHPRLYIRTVQGRYRALGGYRCDAIRIVGREGHRLYRQAHRRR